VTSLLVGTILVVINHGDSLTRGRIDIGLGAQIVLTFVVPFVVSTFSSVAAIEGHREEGGLDPIAVSQPQEMSGTADSRDKDKAVRG
jgi:hypothetical protein